MEFVGLFLRCHFLVSRNAMLAAFHASVKKTSNSLCNIICFIHSVYLLQAANERYFVV